MALLSIYSIVTEFDPRADYSVGLTHALLENPSMRRRWSSNRLQAPGHHARRAHCEQAMRVVVLTLAGSASILVGLCELSEY